MSNTQTYGNKIFTLPASPDKALQEMMNTIDVLRDIYTMETKALESTDTQKFLEIQEKKLLSADRYRQSIEQMMARKDEMSKADPVLKERLKEMQNDFSALADKNKEALSRMQRCSERLSNTLRNAAKKAIQKKRSVAYSETGTLRKNSTKHIPMSISETA